MKRFGITVAAAFAACVLAAMPAQAKTVINLCTGGDGGPYAQAGQMIADQARTDPLIEIRVIKDTGGTWGNIERSTDINGAPTAADYEAGTACQAFIGQPDGPVLLARKAPAEAKRLVSVAKLHTEYLHVLCGKDKDVDNLYDLPGMDNASIALGDAGSGAWLIWQNFVYEDDSYGKVATTTDSGIDAIAAAASGSVTCTIVPAAIGNKTVAEADELYGADLKLVGATDKDFNDAVDIEGKPLYDWGKIPSGTYPTNLQAGWFTSEETVKWRASVYMNTARITDPKAKSAFIRATARARAGIVQTFGGE